jgi:lipopolysaccharide export LptBFGC system permease protein LptF
MMQWSPLTLRQIVERTARLSPPRYRDLVRGMVTELDSIPDRAERTRFALGAIAAIARLTLRGYTRATVYAPKLPVSIGETMLDTISGGPPMPQPTTWQLLRRLTMAFAVSCASLTLLLLTNQAVRQVPQLRGTGAAAGEIADVLLLSVPFTVALTIPMAVFVAVSWVFSRLGAEGVLASARRERHGFQRLLGPVLVAAAVVATLTLVLNTQVVPRANARLAAVRDGTPRELNDRTMTVGELREAARQARTSTGVQAAARAVAYEVEIQKKFALAAACILLALAGAATAIRFPHSGRWLVLGASAFVFTGYYLALVAGETLADRQVISPWVAMWMANAVLGVVVLLLVRRSSRSGTAQGAESLAIGE